MRSEICGDFIRGVAGRTADLDGSHLDTVRMQEAFDGILGVVLAAGLVESLNGLKLPFGIEVIAFRKKKECGSEFHSSEAGALVGRVDEELLNHKDERGISVRRRFRISG